MITFLCFVIFIIWVISDAINRIATNCKIAESAREYEKWITELEKKNGIKRSEKND